MGWRIEHLIKKALKRAEGIKSEAQPEPCMGRHGHKETVTKRRKEGPRQSRQEEIHMSAELLALEVPGEKRNRSYCFSLQGRAVQRFRIQLLFDGGF